MNLEKSYDFFRPETLISRIHIIGCGAIGSTVAENLVRFGITKITLYDFDKVEPHNIANQMYRNSDIGKLKVEALAEYLIDINPELKKNLKIESRGYINQPLSGYIFLCVDSIELRKEIATKFKDSGSVKAMFDFRMGLTDAQHYAADWTNRKMIETFLSSMNFTADDVVREGTTVSGCNLELSVVPTVRLICATGVANFINFVKQGNLKQTIFTDAFATVIDAF